MSVLDTGVVIFPGQFSHFHVPQQLPEIGKGFRIAIECGPLPNLAAGVLPGEKNVDAMPVGIDGQHVVAHPTAAVAVANR